MIFSSRLRIQICLSILVTPLLHIGCTPKSSHLNDHIVVKVNNSGITAERFSELLASRLKVFNDLSAKDSAVVAQAKNSVVQDFIVRVVTQEWAQKNQLFVRKEQLEKEMRQLRKQYPDDIAFRKALADEGQTYDSWEERLSYTLLERMVLENLRKQIAKPSSDEIKSYYTSNKSLFQQKEAVKLRQIVLDSDINAQRIKKELAAGKSMSDLAKKFSNSPEGAQGGEVGWIERGYLDVFDAAFRMGVGQRSQVVKSPFGYHIFEVLAKRPSRTLPIEDARSKIEQILISQKEQAVYSSWLEEQILKARVFKDDEFLKQIQVQTRSL